MVLLNSFSKEILSNIIRGPCLDLFSCMELPFFLVGFFALNVRCSLIRMGAAVLASGIVRYRSKPAIARWRS
jgi:hypothetical protein